MKKISFLIALLLLTCIVPTLMNAQIPTNGLVAYFPFNGNATDASPTGNNGTVFGATIASDRFGNSNAAYDFDGVNDYISIPNHAAYAFQSHTISLWFKYDGPGSASNKAFWTLINKNSGNNTFTSAFHLYVKNDIGVVAGDIGDGISTSNHVFWQTSSFVNDQAWHHVVYVFDANKDSIIVYVDNSKALQQYYGYNFYQNNKDIVMGVWSAFQNYFNGMMDDLRIYSAAMTPDQITALYNECGGGTSPIQFYADADGDGFGNAGVMLTACTQPEGYVIDNTDCDDANVAIHPASSETCNNLDDDCNGQVDEGILLTFYADADGDDFGDELITLSACSKPTGYVIDNTDCNDESSDVYPGAVEICFNGIDENCNGQIDEDCIVCEVPSNLIVTNITGTSAFLKWDEIPGSIGYSVRYKPSGAGEWIELKSKNTQKLLTGLSSSTVYACQVRAICSTHPIVASKWSDKQVFATAFLKMYEEASAQKELVSVNVYPNPLLQSGKVVFVLEQETKVSIDIFDANGKLLKVIANEFYTAGHHEVPFTRASMISGIYFVQVRTSNAAISNKLIVQ